MGKASKVIALAVLYYIIYLVLVGASSLVDYLMGCLAAAVTAYLTADLLVSRASKLVNPSRLGYLIAYVLKYMLVVEPRAHLDVIKRIVSPSMPIRPGIVEVPYDLRTDYAVLTVANSITNTPGTVVVDVDKDRRVFYVHWIDVKEVTPSKCRDAISRSFEEYARKIFD